MKTYQPVPVELAREVGRQFGKQVIVIIAWDEDNGQIHTTTWGEAARHKEWAAELGPKLAAAAGGATQLAKHYEDYREPGEAARNAAKAEVYRKALQFIADIGNDTSVMDTLKKKVDLAIETASVVLAEAS